MLCAAGVHERLFSVLISYRLSGGDGQRSLGCNVSVWPETMWEREHSPRFHCHGTLPQTTGAAVQGTRARALAEAFPCGAPPCQARRPTEVLMPLVEFCLKRTTSKMNQQLKNNLLVKTDNLSVFIQVILLSLMSSPTYSLRIIPLSELWRDFPWHLNWKECLQPIHQKNVVEKLNLATGKTRQSDNLNVL